MKNKMDIIRSNINNAIKQSGQSRLKITKEAGISYQHLANFLNDTHGGEIGIGILAKLSIALHMPVSYFLGETDAEGNLIVNIDGIKLPATWDSTMKAILALPEPQQKLIHEAIELMFKALEGI